LGDSENAEPGVAADGSGLSRTVQGTAHAMPARGQALRWEDGRRFFLHSGEDKRKSSINGYWAEEDSSAGYRRKPKSGNGAGSGAGGPANPFRGSSEKSAKRSDYSCYTFLMFHYQPARHDTGDRPWITSST
jgi:hypothetical protein